jgi:hypothetical protein
MADIAKSGTPSLSTTLLPNNCTLGGRLAGEAIAAGDACYIKSDGKIWKSTGAAANAAAKVRGYAFKAASVNEAVTLVWDVRFNYGSGLTPGAEVYLSGATAGALADAASTGGTAAIGHVVDATRIELYRSRY